MEVWEWSSSWSREVREGGVVYVCFWDEAYDRTATEWEEFGLYHFSLESFTSEKGARLG